MKKNKAFTLIELIAVLVILAIISLIVAPLLLNIIRRVKDVANKRSIDGYGRAVEYAMANYQLKHLNYPDTFDKLEIEYKGNKVECKTNRINPDYSIYLSECKVNGRLVKDNKEYDGYYHYGILKMTNLEYVDTYGKNLEDALKNYHDEHNEYPSDYTTLTLPPLDKEVSCDVDINPDGTVYLNNCKVDNEDVVDDNNEIYVYGNLYATTNLLKKTNSKSITTYTEGNTHEMYTFDHEATEQTPALTDYRYIGNAPYNYVKFNGDEIWRIIGVFDTDDGTGKYEKRIKLVRNESLSKMQWNELAENEWVDSTLEIYLNNSYVLDDESLSLIRISKYYLAGTGSFLSGEEFYKSERGNLVKTGRNTNWEGLVGLIYPSDYVYTFALGVDDVCYNTSGGDCNGSNPSSSWLYKLGGYVWTITPRSTYTNRTFILNSRVDDYVVTATVYVLPTLYLKPNVKIKSGDGSIDNPYEFEL